MSKKYLKILEGDENVGSVKPKYKKVKNYLAQVQFFQTPKKLEYLKNDIFTYTSFGTQALSIV